MAYAGEKLKEWFMWLHEHPETGFSEMETTAKLRGLLEEAGITVLPTGLETGLVARIDGAGPGHCIALRADMDALPVTEETGLPYASRCPGRMHACGHDAHATMVLGAALLLQERRATWRGSVLVVFQPAEELAEGARRVLDTGALRDAELFLGVHVSPGLPVGALGIRPGPAMAAVDRFAITVRGRGTHAAAPHKGVDPIVVQAALVQSLQTIVSRALDPFDTALVSITHVESGNTWNVIPETAFLEGTVRTLDPAVRGRVETLLRTITEQLAASLGARAEVTWYPGPPAVINDAALCRAAEDVARQAGLALATPENTLGGEDFSCYLEGRPGVFIRVGIGDSAPLHHPRFRVDMAILDPTARYLAQLAQTLLAQVG